MSIDVGYLLSASNFQSNQQFSESIALSSELSARAHKNAIANMEQASATTLKNRSLQSAANMLAGNSQANNSAVQVAGQSSSGG